MLLCKQGVVRGKIKSMPTTVLDADGNEMEALTAEEVGELQKKAESADSLQSKVAELEEERKRLEEEANPNWKALREKTSKLESLIKEKGFELDANGNIKDANAIDPNRLKEEVRNELREESFKETKDELLDEYDNETKPLIEKYVNKLMSGEEKNIKNLKNAIKEAERLVGVGETNKSPSALSGRPPKLNSEGKSFSDTQEGKELAKEMFGDNSFINNK
jgi:hypothetical protein